MSPSKVFYTLVGIFCLFGLSQASMTMEPCATGAGSADVHYVTFDPADFGFGDTVTASYNVTFNTGFTTANFTMSTAFFSYDVDVCAFTGTCPVAPGNQAGNMTFAMPAFPFPPGFTIPYTATMTDNYGEMQMCFEGTFTT